MTASEAGPLSWLCFFLLSQVVQHAGPRLPCPRACIIFINKNAIVRSPEENTYDNRCWPTSVESQRVRVQKNILATADPWPFVLRINCKIWQMKNDSYSCGGHCNWTIIAAFTRLWLGQKWVGKTSGKRCRDAAGGQKFLSQTNCPLRIRISSA